MKRPDALADVTATDGHGCAATTDAIVSDRFELRRIVGAGAMGTVYRAHDRFEGVDVAVKLLHDLTATAALRFEREAAALASLSHPGIVRYLAHGATRAGARFIAMEWLEGETLKARLRRGPLGPSSTATLAKNVLEALAVAHDRGIVHRDLKPANLFVCGETPLRVKVLDFGIATADGAHAVTAEHAVIGTPAYMAPEQARSGRDVDARSDLFSLGCVLFECLTGAPPFVGSSPLAVLARICLDDTLDIAERLAGLPEGLVALIAAMMEKDRERRPRSAAELAAAMAALLPALIELGDQPIGGAPREAVAVPAREQRVVSVVAVRWSSAGTDVGAQRIAAVQAEIAEQFGGRLEAFVAGTGVVRLPNEPVPTDHAARAARCALRLRALIADATIAVASGRAVVGGRAPVGEVIDHAVELLANGRARSITLDDTTAALIEAQFDVTPEPERTLRGERRDDGRPRTVLGKESPCVGRSRELAFLESVYDECRTESIARVVLVTAPAGGGKSRVRHELAARLRARGESPQWLFGRGDSLRAGSPLAILGSALRAAAGVSSDQPAAEARVRIASLAGIGEGAAELAAFLGEIAGVHFPDGDLPALHAARQDPRVMADQTIAAWTRWLRSRTALGPVVLVLEDLHWGDGPSVRFTDTALRVLADRPLLVLALARPEVTGNFPGLWAERDVLRLALPQLTRQSCRRILSSLLPDLPPDGADAIVTRADGNPFFLEELIRAAADGIAVGGGNATPETILGMVQARFDALGTDAKRVLRAAAVFGETFSGDAVQALVDADAESLRHWLDVLCTREVILPHTDAEAASAAPIGSRFAFRHALLRDAAYQLLTDEDRAAAHNRAARWLENAPDADANVLAEHFARAGEHQRAAHWTCAAATQAFEANDLAGALERVDRATRLDPEPETLARLRLVESQARFWRAEYTEAERAARRALQLAHPHERLEAYGELIKALGQQAKYGELEAVVDELLARRESDAFDPAFVGCLVRAAEYLFPAGRYARGSDLLDRAEPFSSQMTPGLTGRLMMARAHEAHVQGRPARLIACCERALRAFEEAGDTRSAAEATGNLAVGLAEVGLLEEAEARFCALVESSDRLGSGYLRAGAALNLVLVRAFLGRLDEARRGIEDLGAELARQKDPRYLGVAREYLAIVAGFAGDHVAAECHARAALETFEKVPPLYPVALATLACALLGQGRTAEALDTARSAYAQFEAQGGVEDLEALVYLAFAECLLAAGDPAAVDVLTRARRRLEERAAAIDEDAWRQAFLRRLPFHARTMELCQRHLRP